MIVIETDRPALLLIDLQKGFEDIQYWGGARNNPDAEINASALLSAWRSLALPIFHIQHCSVNPRSPLRESHEGNAFQTIVKPLPHELIIKKNVNSAFIGTELHQQLATLGITELVLVGLTTDHCISSTARMAGNLGYNTTIVSDATATFDKRGADGKSYSAALLHDTALVSLNDEFATIVTTQFVLQDLRLSFVSE